MIMDEQNKDAILHVKMQMPLAMGMTNAAKDVGV